MNRRWPSICTGLSLIAMTTGCIFAVDHELDDHDEPDTNNGSPPPDSVSIDGPDHLLVGPEGPSLDYQIDCEPDGCEDDLWCRLHHSDDPDDELVSVAPCSTNWTLTADDLEDVDWTDDDGWTAEVQLRRGLQDQWKTDQQETTLEYFETGIEGLSTDAPNHFIRPHIGTYSAHCSVDGCQIETCRWRDVDADDPNQPDCSLDEPFELTVPDADPDSLQLRLSVCTESGDDCTQRTWDFAYRSPTWQTVETGDAHSCGILEDDTLWCWGDNSDGAVDGQLQETTIDQPRHIDVRDQWAQVAAGATHTCAIDDRDRALYCWGVNENQALDPDEPEGAVLSPQIVDDDHHWETIASSYRHSCGVTDVGRLYCWGDDEAHKQGPEPGDDSLVEVPLPDDVDNWADVSAGTQHTCAIAEDTATSKLFCWGRNDEGQVGVNPLDYDTDIATPQHLEFEDGTVESADVADIHGCATIDRDDDHHTYCWGRVEGGRLGDGSDHETHSWSPISVDDDESGPLVDVSTAPAHSCALNTAGLAFCWGNPADGRIGRDPGDFDNDHLAPQLVSAPTDGSSPLGFQQLSAGTAHTCGISADGRLLCWGAGDDGQRGDIDTADDDWVPRPVTWPHADLERFGGD